MPEAANRAQEIERIRAEYVRRDAGQPRALNADFAWLAQVQALEWDLLRVLGAAGVPLTGADVLDVGAGSGFHLGRLVECGAASGTGVELMEDRVSEARRRRPHLDLRQADASQLPFPDATFDVVTQFVCLSSVLDADVRAAIAAEMWRVLRPGGAVVSYDLRPTWAPLAALGRRLRGQGWTPVTPIGADELRRLFPAGTLTLRTVSLNAALPDALRRWRGLALALAVLPLLRSHHLAVVRKPLS